MPQQINTVDAPRPKRRLGFAAMSPELQRQLASQGGRKVQELGRGHQLTSETAVEAGRKGGLTTARRLREREQALRMATD